MFPSVTIVCVKCSIPPTVVIVIPSSTPPTPDIVPRSSKIFLMIVPRRPWLPSPCVRLRTRIQRSAQQKNPLPARSMSKLRTACVASYGVRQLAVEYSGASSPLQNDEAVRETQRLLAQGKILAIKGLGGFLSLVMRRMPKLSVSFVSGRCRWISPLR